MRHSAVSCKSKSTTKSMFLWMILLKTGLLLWRLCNIMAFILLHFPFFPFSVFFLLSRKETEKRKNRRYSSPSYLFPFIVLFIIPFSCSIYHLLSRRFLTWRFSILKMEATFSSEGRLTFNKIHGVISQKTERFPFLLQFFVQVSFFLTVIIIIIIIIISCDGRLEETA
jgi:hypothetical protein